MTKSLHGRVAIVTGAGRGIGLSIANALSKAGANVVIADSGVSIDGTEPDPTIGHTAAEKIGGSSIAFTEGLTSPTAAKALVDYANDSFGRIDIVVNNAAILRDSFIFKGDPTDWDSVIETNLSAAYYLLAAATPLLRAQSKANKDYKNGRIVNITSTAGFYGNFGQATYASAKAGLLGLTRAVALDMARAGITCNAVAPFATTRVTETIQPANESQAKYKARALRLPADHVATFVTYLCDEKAQHVSGQLFAVRGREVFIFNQPRPKARTVNTETDWSVDTLAVAVDEELKSSFTALETDLEAFNTEPVI